MPPQSKYSFSFVAVLALSLILSVRAGYAADQVLSPPDAREFGGEADIQGNIAVIGNQHSRDALGVGRGHVHILERGPEGWQVVKILLPPATGDSFSRFGAQVTLSGNRLAIGDPHFGETGHVGRVYIYEKQGSIWPDQPAYVITPSQPSVFSFGQAHAFSGDYLAVTEFVSFDLVFPEQMLVRVKTFRLQNGQATPLGQVESRGGDFFGFEMSMSGSELAILRARKGMLLPPTQGTVLLYELSGGTMRQTASLPVPMTAGDIISSPKVKMEGDRILVTKITPPSAGAVIFKRTASGWRASSEIRPPQPGELSDYLVDAAGNTLVSSNGLGADLYTISEPPKFVRRLALAGTYGLATSTETAMLAKSNRVLFTSVRSLVASDTVIADPSQASAPGGEIFLGEVKAGQACKVEVELQNASAEPLPLTGVQITPVEGANSLTDHFFTPVTLPPLGKTKVKLTLTPPSVGSYRMSLEALHPDSARAPYTYTIDFYATADLVAPIVVENNGGMLVVKGDPVKLDMGAAGLRGQFNCQWYKDDRALAGSTKPYLYIASAAPAHAGRYRLDVWSTASPRMSGAMTLGVYQKKASSVVSKAGESINLTAQFWGPGMRVRWLYGYNQQQPIPGTWVIQGTQSPTLTIPSSMALAGYGPFKISAELTMDEGTTVISNDHVVEVHRIPVIAVTGARHGRVGELIAPLNISDLTGHREGVVLSVEGVPPGLQLTNSGFRIEGTPTKAGSYTVKVMAENRYGTAVPFKLNFRIYPAAQDPSLKLDFGTLHKTAGIAMLPDSDQEAPEWPGLLQVQSTSGTGFTGSLAFGSVRRPFSGQWTVKIDEAARSATVRLTPFLGYRSVVLNLNQAAAEESLPSNGIDAQLIFEHMSPDGGLLENYTYLEPLIHPNKEWSIALAGRYSFLMGGLVGQGFGSFTVSSAFHATGAGTLADGTGFTFSMPMVMSPNGPSNGTVMMVRLGPGPVRLWGQITVAAAGLEEAGLVTGSLMMARPAEPGARLLPEGYNTEVPVRGARYFLPKGVPLFTPPYASLEQAGRTTITLAADGIPEYIQTGLTFTKAGKVIVDQPNTSDLKMDMYMPTGFFTGSFKINELMPGTEDRFVRRTVFFRGMVIPQLRIGGGFFHFSPLPNRFAEPPTTSATTPIYVGGVTLE